MIHLSFRQYLRPGSVCLCYMWGLHVIVKKMSKMEDSFFLVGVGVGLGWRGGGLFIKRIFFQVYTPLPNVILFPYLSPPVHPLPPFFFPFFFFGGGGISFSLIPPQDGIGRRGGGQLRHTSHLLLANLFKTSIRL